MLSEQPLVPPGSPVSAVGPFELPSSAATPTEMLESAPAAEDANQGYKTKHVSGAHEATRRTDLIDFKSSAPVAGHTAKSSRAEESALDVSFDLAVVSDYRRAGVTRSNGPAIQGAFDLEFANGWSAGVFASSTDSKHQNFEVALYGAKEFEFGDTELTVGATAIVDVDLQRLDFGIAQASVSHPIGPFDVTLGVNYVWEQSHLDDQDNLYLVARAKSLIGTAFGAPLTLGVSTGRMEGRLAGADVRMDWSVSLTADVNGTDIALSYVDNDLDDDRGDAGFVISIAHTF